MVKKFLKKVLTNEIMFDKLNLADALKAGSKSADSEAEP